jgi:hypothetical protein
MMIPRRFDHKIAPDIINENEGDLQLDRILSWQEYHVQRIPQRRPVRGEFEPGMQSQLALLFGSAIRIDDTVLGPEVVPQFPATAQC